MGKKRTPIEYVPTSKRTAAAYDPSTGQYLPQQYLPPVTITADRSVPFQNGKFAPWLASKGIAEYVPIESALLPATPIVRGLGKFGNMALDAVNPLGGMMGPKALEGFIQSAAKRADTQALGQYMTQARGMFNKGPKGIFDSYKNLQKEAVDRYRWSVGMGIDNSNALPTYPLDKFNTRNIAGHGMDYAIRNDISPMPSLNNPWLTKGDPGDVVREMGRTSYAKDIPEADQYLAWQNWEAAKRNLELPPNARLPIHDMRDKIVKNLDSNAYARLNSNIRRMPLGRGPETLNSTSDWSPSLQPGSYSVGSGNTFQTGNLGPNSFVTNADVPITPTASQYSLLPKSIYDFGKPINTQVNIADELGKGSYSRRGINPSPLVADPNFILKGSNAAHVSSTLMTDAQQAFNSPGFARQYVEAYDPYRQGFDIAPSMGVKVPENENDIMLEIMPRIQGENLMSTRGTTPSGKPFKIMSRDVAFDRLGKADIKRFGQQTAALDKDFYFDGVGDNIMYTPDGRLHHIDMFPKLSGLKKRYYGEDREPIMNSYKGAVLDKLTRLMPYYRDVVKDIEAGRMTKDMANKMLETSMRVGNQFAESAKLGPMDVDFNVLPESLFGAGLNGLKKFGSGGRLSARTPSGREKEMTPVYVRDPRDPNLLAYRDSLDAFNSTDYFRRHLNPRTRIVNADAPSLRYQTHVYEEYLHPRLKPSEIIAYDYTKEFPLYKKPVQPVIYKKDQVVDKMPMRGMPDTNVSAQPIGITPVTAGSAPFYMDYRGEWTEQRPTAYPYSNEQLLKMGYRQSLPKKKFGSFIKDVGLTVGDLALSPLNKDIISNDMYSSADLARVTDTVGGLQNMAAPMVATALGGPAAGMAMSGAQQLSNNFVQPDMAQGGQLQDRTQDAFIQYNGPSHENGGIPVDAAGVPSHPGMASAEVEGGETSYKSYVFSDRLKDPKTGKTFADASKAIYSRYKGADDSLGRRGFEMEINRLMASNEELRINKEMNSYKRSLKKFLPQKDWGGLTNDQWMQAGIQNAGNIAHLGFTAFNKPTKFPAYNNPYAKDITAQPRYLDPTSELARNDNTYVGLRRSLPGATGGSSAGLGALMIGASRSKANTDASIYDRYNQMNTGLDQARLGRMQNLGEADRASMQWALDGTQRSKANRDNMMFADVNAIGANVGNMYNQAAWNKLIQAQSPTNYYDQYMQSKSPAGIDPLGNPVSMRPGYSGPVQGAIGLGGNYPVNQPYTPPTGFNPYAGLPQSPRPAYSPIQAAPYVPLPQRSLNLNPYPSTIPPYYPPYEDNLAPWATQSGPRLFKRGGFLYAY